MRTYDIVMKAATPFVPMNFSFGLVTPSEENQIENPVIVKEIDRKANTYLLMMTS